MWWHGGAGLIERSERGTLYAVATHDLLASSFGLIFDGNSVIGKLFLQYSGVAFEDHEDLGVVGPRNLCGALVDNESTPLTIRQCLSPIQDRSLRVEAGCRSAIAGEQNDFLRSIGRHHLCAPFVGAIVVHATREGQER